MQGASTEALTKLTLEDVCTEWEKRAPIFCAFLSSAAVPAVRCKILHSCRSYPNILVYLEALYIKYNHPVLNCSLKASKELTLFP